MTETAVTHPGSAYPVTAVAHPNIALAKYWGKRDGVGNYPAVPSLSVTLAGMSTTTRVRFAPELSEDRFVLNGHAVVGEASLRVVALLNRVRAGAGLALFADVVSTNDFPTSSGLASSASGFAALALAATRAAGLDWDAGRVSDLARRSSASAARSLFGGFVELGPGPFAPGGDEVCAARVVCPENQLDLRVIVCVTTDAEKAIGSTAAMKVTKEKSPYYAAWLEQSHPRFWRLREGLLARDFDAMGTVAEESALAMHACALGAGIVYFNQASLDLLAAVRGLRASGVSAYATMDAGPHVKVLVLSPDEKRVETVLKSVPGVVRILRARPGAGAHLTSSS